MELSWVMGVTPSHHPFLDGIFSLTKTIQLLGCPHGHGNPHIPINTGVSMGVPLVLMAWQRKVPVKAKARAAKRKARMWPADLRIFGRAFFFFQKNGTAGTSKNGEVIWIYIWISWFYIWIYRFMTWIMVIYWWIYCIWSRFKLLEISPGWMT